MLVPIYRCDRQEITRFTDLFITKYGSAIYNLIIKMRNEEDLIAYSCKSQQILQYDLAFMLAYTVMIDYTTTNQDWSYYVNKYQLEDKHGKLACSNINMDELFEIFGLPLSTTTPCVRGIGTMGIITEPCDFVVDGDELPVGIELHALDVFDLPVNPIYDGIAGISGMGFNGDIEDIIFTIGTVEKAYVNTVDTSEYEIDTEINALELLDIYANGAICKYLETC